MPSLPEGDFYDLYLNKTITDITYNRIIHTTPKLSSSFSYERALQTADLLHASVSRSSDTDSLGAEYNSPEFQLESSMLITPDKSPSCKSKLIVLV